MKKESACCAARRHSAGFVAETDRLLATVLPQDAVVPAMADGGSLVDHLYREIDDDTWKRLTEAFFDMAPQP